MNLITWKVIIFGLVYLFNYTAYKTSHLVVISVMLDFHRRRNNIHFENPEPRARKREIMVLK